MSVCVVSLILLAVSVFLSLGFKIVFLKGCCACAHDFTLLANKRTNEQTVGRLVALFNWIEFNWKINWILLTIAIMLLSRYHFYVFFMFCERFFLNVEFKRMLISILSDAWYRYFMQLSGTCVTMRKSFVINLCWIFSPFLAVAIIKRTMTFSFAFNAIQFICLFTKRGRIIPFCSAGAKIPFIFSLMFFFHTISFFSSFFKKFKSNKFSLLCNRH